MRVVLAVALVLVAGAMAVDMSGRAPRMAGSDHTLPVAFVATMHAGQELCQPEMALPSDAQRVQVLVGTYGPPVPELTARFIGPRGHVRADGRLPAGAVQGDVSIPIAYPHGATAEGTLCIGVKGGRTTVLGGDVFPAGPVSERIGGVPKTGRIAVTYLRPGRESWWQLLPALSERFGLGKASFFGGWTFPAVLVLLLGVWLGTVRLLRRELV